MNKPFSECGGNFSNLTGSIITPSYPGYYASDTECSWTITAPSADYYILLVFEYLDLGYNDNVTVSILNKILLVNTIK